MRVDRLCFLRPLAGLENVFSPKLSRFDQPLRSSGDCLTRSSRLDNAVQQAGLADLGMCLMIGTFVEG